MHAAMLTLILTAGASPYGTIHGGYNGGHDCSYPEGVINDPAHYHYDIVTKNFVHIPQTCYSPRFGCYPGNGREIHRYPAFHGCFYRRPYNYRNVFDYPWHAELHEPTSYFSINKVHDPRSSSILRPNSSPAVPIPAPPSAWRAPWSREVALQRASVRSEKSRPLRQSTGRRY